MFGDYGIYCDGKLFGLISDGRLYIKPLSEVFDDPSFLGHAFRK